MEIVQTIPHFQWQRMEARSERTLFRYQNAVLLSTAQQCSDLNHSLQEKQFNTTISANCLWLHSDKQHSLGMDNFNHHEFVTRRDKESCTLACNAEVSSTAGSRPDYNAIEQRVCVCGLWSTYWVLLYVSDMWTTQYWVLPRDDYWEGCGESFERHFDAMWDFFHLTTKETDSNSWLILLIWIALPIEYTIESAQLYEYCRFS